MSATNDREVPVQATDEESITFVEFYAGVGGWSMALSQAMQRCAPKRRLDRLAALDHSDLCLKVLEHNFSSQSTKTVSIERLTLAQVQEWNATIWCMSPPCQPHTRQHQNQQQDLLDPRSKSFLHLCDLFDQMDDSKLPRLLFIENVIGFESSNSFQRWRHMLKKRNYKVGHFHLNPTQVGVPNDRPRYFGVASLGAESSNDPSLSRYLNVETNEQSSPRIQTSIPELGVVSPEIVTNLPRISQFLDHDSSSRLRIPDKLLNSSAAWCFDIVTPEDRRSACFTQSYGKFIRGTGSVLWQSTIESYDTEACSRFALIPPEEREFNPDWSKGLDLKKKLRYFSGMEVARLMGFDDTVFSFPPDCSLKQQWKLLGNSLNVKVAAAIVELGLRNLR